jgi:putative N-acetylmannosamine-6-phosphate epimerase
VVFRGVDSFVETDIGELDISSPSAVVTCVELSPTSLLLEKMLEEVARNVEESVAETLLTSKDSDNDEEALICARLGAAVVATDVSGLVSSVVELETEIVSAGLCDPVDAIVAEESWNNPGREFCALERVSAVG